MRYPGWIIGICASLWGASAEAIPSKAGNAGLYVRARAAEAAGDTRAAVAGFAALLADDPGSTVVATRAYRQAIVAGDMALAARAAHLLDMRQMLPPDGAILLALEHVRAHNWPQARVAAERLAQDRVFGFLAPYFRAWIAVGSGQGDALAQLNGGIAMPLAAPYHDEQRAFLLIAMGRGKEAQAAGSARGMQLPAEVKGAEQGLAFLFAHVAADFQRQQLTPVGLIMARLGSYSAPDFAPGWLVLADLLRTMQRPDLALAALDHISTSDPLVTNAAALRIGLLHDSGKNDAALVEALANTTRAGAGAGEWGRLGDLYVAMNRPADAAAAYARAVRAAEGPGVAPNMIWPLLLQQGAALDQAGDWEGSKAALSRAYALAPDQAVILNQLGYSQIEHHEDLERAAKLIIQASKLRPDDPAIIDSLGWVTYLRGNPLDAAPLIERAAAGAPGEPAINEHLGDVYWALGRQYEARYAWRAALITADDKDRPRLIAKIDTGLGGATAAP